MLMYRKIGMFWISLVYLCKALPAQPSADTVHLTLPEAEKVFLQKNLCLVAAKYNIDVNKALARQAALWDNPTLVTDQNVYDGNFFRHTQNEGQVYIQLQQLIRTAGKIKKQTKLANDNVQLANLQFDELMRNLQYTLRNDFIETWHLLKEKTVYDLEISEVRNLVNGMGEVYKAGNISQKDYMRLQALLFGLQNELVNIEAQLIPLQNEIKLLLQSTERSFIAPRMVYYLPDLIGAKIADLDSLVYIALNKRPDALMSQANLIFQKDNLTYQKALSKPDITIGPEYDRRNSYEPNYVGLGISLPLNIFNRNQGNIKAATAAIKQQQSANDYAFATIRSEVATVFDRVKYFQKINNSEQLEFSKSYDALFRNMLQSYQSRQISLLDFTDFLDSYKDNKLKIVEQHIGLVKSIADLNYAVGSTIISLQ